MPRRTQKNATDAPIPLAVLLEGQNADDVRKLLAFVPIAGRPPTRKGDMIALIAEYLNEQGLRQLWDLLDETQKAAVAEVVHSDSYQFQAEAFQAKYGKSPDFGKTASYVRTPSRLCLFIMGHAMPLEIKPRLLAFVPKPRATNAIITTELPETYEIRHAYRQEVVGVEPIRQVMMENAAQQDLLTVLRLVQAGKIAVSDKTRYPGNASLQAIAAVLQGGDFYTAQDEGTEPYAQKIGEIKPFAWCLLLQAAGLAELSGKKLQLTKAGQKALTDTPAKTLRTIWQKWQKTTLIDEFRRVDEIKGQGSKGGRHMTAVAGRRLAIYQALAECAIGDWFAIDAFFRYMQAKQHRFEITRNAWTLYITDVQYGALGYAGFDAWEILQGRYTMALLFEYAATLGLIDVAYVRPQGVRRDFRNNWGTDDLAFLSRYDGLLYFRVNPLGAYCLGVVEDYQPSPIEVKPILKVLPNLDVVAIADVSMSDRLMLEAFLKSTGDRVWQMSLETLLAAVESGRTITELREFLQAKSPENLPQTVAQLLSDADSRSQSLQIRGMAMVVACQTPALAALIANNTQTKKFCYLAGDRYLVVALDTEKQFRTAVRKLGYSLPQS